MQLTKEAIDDLRFNSYKGKYYDSAEVDDALEKLADAADKQQDEIRSLKTELEKYKAQLEGQEIAELVALADEYRDRKNDIAEALIVAQEAARKSAEEAKARYVAEINALEAQKIALQNEMDVLEEQRDARFRSIQTEIAQFAREFGMVRDAEDAE